MIDILGLSKWVLAVYLYRLRRDNVGSPVMIKRDLLEFASPEGFVESVLLLGTP